MNQMLLYDPSDRISWEELLKHKWFKNIEKYQESIIKKYTDPIRLQRTLLRSVSNFIKKDDFE